MFFFANNNVFVSTMSFCVHWGLQLLILSAKCDEGGTHSPKPMPSSEKLWACNLWHNGISDKIPTLRDAADALSTV